MSTVGRSEDILAYELLPQEQFDLELNQRYLKAFEMIDSNPDQAAEILDSIVKEYPDEDTHLPAFHLRRLREGEIGTTIHIE